MALHSGIEWTETTWNPITGCTKISDGCKFCYADRIAKRLKAAGVKKYRNGFQVTLHPSTLQDPLKWRKPRLIFVNSMSDLFHEEVPLSFIKSVFQTMNRASQHTFQVLTKRPKRVLDIQDELTWNSNIWLGTSIESQRWDFRLRDLSKTKAKTKFLSLEPLLGPLTDIQVEEVDWVIVGGESGPGARLMEANWVREIRDSCLRKQVPFFFKQWGGVFKKNHGRTLDGEKWDQMPIVVSDKSVAS